MNFSLKFGNLEIQAVKLLGHMPNSQGQRPNANARKLTLELRKLNLSILLKQECDFSDPIQEVELHRKPRHGNAHRGEFNEGEQIAAGNQQILRFYQPHFSLQPSELGLLNRIFEPLRRPLPT